MKNAQMIILAGGMGTRMKSDNPKSLTPLAGKPFLKHITDMADSLELSFPPVIVVGYKRDQVMKALGSGFIYAEQSEQLGTGHAVASAKDRVDPKSSAVLVLSSDQPLVSKETVENLLKEHFAKKPAVTIATMAVPDFEEWRKGLRHFGRIVRGPDGEVEGIVEFKDATEKEKMIKELNPALYVFDPKWLWQNIGLLKNDNAKKEYYLTDMIKIAREQGKKIATAPLQSLIEGCQPNTTEEVTDLEKLLAKTKTQ